MSEIKAKRLLVVTQYFWPEEFRVNELVTKLSAKGYEIDVVTGIPNYPGGEVYEEFSRNPKAYSVYSGITVHRVNNSPRGSTKRSLFLNYLSFAFRASAYLCWNLRKEKYDAIFVMQVSPVFSVIPALLFGKPRKIKVITWILDLWPDILTAISAVKNRFILAVLKRISGIIYRASDTLLISSAGFERRLVELGAAEKNIHRFPQWVEEVMNVDRLQSTPEFVHVGELVKKYEGKKRIVFTGNIGESQDFPSVVKSIEILKERRDLVFLIVGSGRAEVDIKKLVHEKGLDENVQFLGRYPAEFMPAFYYHADALLVSLSKDPLFEITLPGKVQSYLYAGRPIVGMIEGEGASVLVDSGSALVNDAGDYSGLARSIENLFRLENDEREQMGKAGKKYAEENYLADNLIDNLLNIIESD